MRVPVTILFATLLLVPGCDRNNPTRTRAASEQESTPNADMRRQRDDYVKAVDARLNEFDKNVEGLEARADKMTGTTKNSFMTEIDQLRGQREMVARKLDDLKKVNPDSWLTMKSDVGTALSNLERSYQALSAKYEPSATTSRSPVKIY